MAMEELETSMKIFERPHLEEQEYQVAFSGRSQSYCIGMVDIINSTQVAANMHEREWCKYYVIFLNSMSKILSKFGGVPLKNGGDSLLYYFPDSSQSKTPLDFMNCLECNLAMTTAHSAISELIKTEGLPKLDYRISSDYGKVVIMEPNRLSPHDIIGPPVNMCAKINHSAAKNGIIIGGDLYEMTKDIHGYRFKQKEGFSIGLKYSYPLYEVTRKI